MTRRLLIFTLLIASAAVGTRFYTVVGISTPTIPASVTAALSLAATRRAYSFILPEVKTLSKVRIYASAVNGTLGTNDLVCALHADATDGSTKPGTLIESRNTVTATPTGAAWVEFTGFTAALTAHTKYWLILSNANGTPASNYPTYRHVTAGIPVGNWATSPSTDSGSTWAAPADYIAGPRLEFSDGSFDGLPVQNGGVSSATVYAAREIGVLFTSPANAGLTVAGVSGIVRRTGSPTGSLVFKLRVGGSTYTTQGIVPGSVGTADTTVTAYFATPVTVAAGSSVRVTLAESAQSDTSSNTYGLWVFTLDNSATDRALMPFGSWVRTSTTDGSAFTETNTEAPVIGLLVSGYTAPAASSGGAWTFVQ